MRIGPHKEWVPVIELYRDNPPGLPRGDAHLAVHGFKRPRTGKTLCGKPTKGMLKCGNFFNGWEQVLCPECDSLLEV